MRRIEVGTWAIGIADRLKQGHPIEDARVELKTTWPDPKAAARQIAGHANAAQGEPILWLIGINEKSHQIVGAEMNDRGKV